MSVQIGGSSSVVVNVNVGGVGIQPVKSGSLVANGTEQLILEFAGTGRVFGYIDLKDMQAGDKVVLRQYMKLVEGGSYEKYADQEYSDVQAIPVVYVTPKETDFGIKITLQQTAGVMRGYDYNLMKES